MTHMQGGTEADVKAMIGKARVANVLSPKKNKIRIFNTNVKAVLLCRTETRRNTMTATKRIQTFVNSCYCWCLVA